MNADHLIPAPSDSPDLPQVLGHFATLSEGLDYAARGITGFNFYSPRGALEHVLTYTELRQRALDTARRLVAAGLERGDRVAVVAETGPDFMAVFFGCQYAGLVPCPVPYSMYIGGRDAYVERIAGMLTSADVALAITPADLESHLREAAAIAGVKQVLTHEALRDLAPFSGDLEPFGPGDVAYIQYSSGSTSHPKGVLISQAAITANVQGILNHGLRIRRNDRAFSWLPLYHDMGLVGFCLSSMMGQVTVDYMATTAFARRPVLWLKLMSDNQCTVSYSPSFGYDLAARRVNGEAKTLKLSQWRIAGIGGDMVRPDVLEAFAKALEPSGFDITAFMPSYGMAEASLAISFADLDSHFVTDVIDRAHSKLTRRAVPVADKYRDNPDRARVFVGCGRPLPGHEMQVRDDSGEVLGERQIGHVLVRGPSLMSGYFRNPEATDAVIRADGFMDTGDMGYWLDGQIVITGRSKDLILHNGRNIWPQDIEWAAEHIETLRPGDVAAFAVEGRDASDEVVVLVQCRLSDPAGIEELRKAVAATVQRSAGIECRVVMVPPKSLPFTSSGKLSRAGARARFMSGEIGEIARPMPMQTQIDRRAIAAG